MDNLASLMQGFADVSTFDALVWSIVGVLLGTIIGALPGLGPVAGIAILLPLSFTLDTISALVLLMAIYQGSMYGGRISSILINVPGEPSAVVTTFDGYPLTRQGRAGYALSLSAIASFVGGMIGFVGLVFLMPYLSAWGLRFGPPEMFALMLFALIATSGFGQDDLLKGLVSLGLGLVVAVIGMDTISGDIRTSYGTFQLWDGVSFVAIAVGLFGVSEALSLVLERSRPEEKLPDISLRELVPSMRDLGRNAGSITRGSLIGYLVGVLPGAGATVATFISYTVEKKVSRNPEKFGHGAEQGLSGPEAANNASIGGALVPLFTLGIPSSAITAVLLGALITVGLQPGPRMLETSGDVIWAIIAGLFLANVMLLVLNTAFVPVFTVLIRWVQPYLISFIAVLCIIGVYFDNFSFFDVGVMLVFGVIGYFMRLFRYPLSPLILAVVLGPMLESSLRQSLLLSANSPEIFLTRPIAATLLTGTVLILAFSGLRFVWARVRR